MDQTLLVDFDTDGYLDVFSGGGSLTSTLPQELFIWENANCSGTEWTQHEILSGKRCHEAKAPDVDCDGDIKVCSKTWNGDEHVYLRNMLTENAPKGTRAVDIKPRPTGILARNVLR